MFEEIIRDYFSMKSSRIVLFQAMSFATRILKDSFTLSKVLYTGKLRNKVQLLFSKFAFNELNVYYLNDS